MEDQTKSKGADQLEREQIPSLADIPTQYRPTRTLVMVKPLESIKQVGSIHLPQGSELIMNEGHVLAKGSLVSADIQIGDCVTWDNHSEHRMKIDDVRFVLVQEHAIIMKIPNTVLDPTRAAPKVVDLEELNKLT